MKQNAFKIQRWMMAAAVCSALCLTGVTNAQNAEKQVQTDSETTLEPLFSMSSVFQDGTLSLQRENQSKFILKRQGSQAYLKFDDDPETWALTISTGPGNSELFKNDIGRLFLRLSDSGNLSLYTPDYPGEPIAIVDDPARIGPPDLQDATEFETELSTYLSLRLGREITISVNADSPAQEIWLQDAARLAVKAMAKSARDAKSLNHISLVVGKSPELAVEHKTDLIVTVTPDKGYYGRPSSDRIILFLKGRFNS